MGSRVRRPEVDILPLTDGDTITVKRYLTAGEFRVLVKMSTKPIHVDAATAANGHDLTFDVDPTESGIGIVLAYLLDWTFTDFDGRPLVIRDQPTAVVRAALDAIDATSYMEVQKAVQAHDQAMRAYIAAEKKNDTWRDGARSDLAICRVMGWTLGEVWDLPMHYYEFLIDELNREQSTR